MADSKEQLDNDTDEMLSIGQGAPVSVCRYDLPADGGPPYSPLPLASARYLPYRTLNTESLAVFMPFKVQEVQEPGGCTLASTPFPGT